MASAAYDGNSTYDLKGLDRQIAELRHRIIILENREYLDRHDKSDDLPKRGQANAQYDYYDLPKDKRWLKNGESPYSIGGQDTDIETIGLCLQSRVREMYSINGVPLPLHRAIDDPTVRLAEDDRAIQSVISLVSQYVANRAEVVK